MISAAPSAIGCCAEAETRSAPATDAGRLLHVRRLEERHPVLQVVEDVVVRARLVEGGERHEHAADDERTEHVLDRGHGPHGRVHEEVATRKLMKYESDLTACV